MLVLNKKSILSITSIIFLLALITRFIFLLEIIDHPLFIPTFRGLDPSLYHDLAIKILSGDFNKVYSATLLYPLILSGIYFISNTSILLAKFIQIALGSLSCVLVFLITKKIFNKKSALLASLMSILYPVAIAHEVVLLYTTYVIFLNLSSMLFLLSKRLSFIKALTIGILTGLSFLLSPQSFIFIIGIFAWIIFYKKESFKKVLIIILGLILVVTPFMLRNLLTGGYLSPTTAYFGVAFYVANNPYSEGAFRIIPGINFTKKSAKEFKLLAQTRTGTQLTPNQANFYWLRQALRFIKNNPKEYLKLQMNKILLFFNGAEYPDIIQNLAYFKSYSYLIRILSLFSFGVIGPLALMGIVLTFKNTNAKLLLLYILGYLVMLMIFHVTSRYRLPAIYAFFPFAGYFLIWCYEKIKKRAYYLMFYASLCLVVFAVFVNFKLPICKSDKLSSYNQGVIYVSKGDFDKALDEYKKALDENPADYNSYFAIGEISYRKGEYKDAVLNFKRCIELNPYFLDAYYNLGLTLFELGKYKKANFYIGELIKLDPQDAEAHYLLGEIYLENKDYKKATCSFNAAVGLNPGLRSIIQEELDLIK